MADERVRWQDAEPLRFERELEAVRAVAPALVWVDDRDRWEGELPLWPFERDQPAGLDGFVGDRRFSVHITYSQGFPMVAPQIVPIDPTPEFGARIQHAWHLNGDGSLCLLQSADAWDGSGTAADLVLKGASWFLEYLLMEAGQMTKMSENGIVTDPGSDHLLAVGSSP